VNQACHVQEGRRGRPRLPCVVEPQRTVLGGVERDAGTAGEQIIDFDQSLIDERRRTLADPLVVQQPGSMIDSVSL
jgi:hypothetical protein